MRIPFFFFVTLFFTILCYSCTSGDKSGEVKKEELEIEDSDLLMKSSSDVSDHESFSKATGLFKTLFKQDAISDFGLLPFGEEAEEDLSEFFPGVLLSYNLISGRQIAEELTNLYHYTTSYKKQEESVVFSMYKFESSLKMLEFFMAIDSIYSENSDLHIKEIKILDYEGWEVLDKDGQRIEVCLVLPDTRLIQGSAGEVFKGDLIELLNELELRKL